MIYKDDNVKRNGLVVGYTQSKPFFDVRCFVISPCGCHCTEVLVLLLLSMRFLSRCRREVLKKGELESKESEKVD